MLVDGCWCTVVTRRFDTRSLARNGEASVCVCDTGLVAAMTDVFEEELAASKTVARYAWPRRGLLTRAQELVASRLKEQV